MQCLFTERLFVFHLVGGDGEIPWCFSQVKGTIEDEVADGMSIVFISIW